MTNRKVWIFFYYGDDFMSENGCFFFFFWSMGWSRKTTWWQSRWEIVK